MILAHMGSSSSSFGAFKSYRQARLHINELLSTEKQTYSTSATDKLHDCKHCHRRPVDSTYRYETHIYRSWPISIYTHHRLHLYSTAKASLAYP